MTRRLTAFVRAIDRDPSRAKMAALLSAVFILAMVPLGRPIQALGESAGRALGGWADVLVGLAAAALAIPYAAFYISIAKLFSRTFAALHFAAGVTAFAVFYYTVFLPIEAAHVLMFATFTAAYRLSRIRRPELTADLRAFVAGVLLAVLDEALQGLHPQRVFDTRDILLDAEAALIGLLFVKPLVRAVRILEHNGENRQ